LQFVAVLGGVLAVRTILGIFLIVAATISTASAQSSFSMDHGHAADAARAASAATLETKDFWKTLALRKAIHDRERGACFYCLRHAPGKLQCLDHVVPRVRFGRNSYRNLVSCCIECNTRKADRPVRDFLGTLYRQGRLTAKELDARLRALKDLAAGKLRPSL